MKKSICLFIAILLCLTISPAYAADLGVQIITEKSVIEKPIPFYVRNETGLDVVTEKISEIFVKQENFKIRTDTEALDYYLSADLPFTTNYVVYNNSTNALIRKYQHLIICDYVSADVVKPVIIILDLFLHHDPDTMHSEYYFAFQDGFVLVETDYGRKYRVNYFDRKENSIRSFKAETLTASLDELVYVFTDEQGRIIYFDLENNACGILNIDAKVSDVVYAGYCNYLVCLDEQKNYTLIDINTMKAYATLLPANTIYVDEDVYVINDEFSLKLVTNAATSILIKKADNYWLHGLNARFVQYGNVLSIPSGISYVFQNGNAIMYEDSYPFTPNRVNRFEAKNGIDGLSKYQTQFYDKWDATFKEIPALPQEGYHWQQFYNPDSIIFTPDVFNAQNFSTLQNLGYFVYYVDSNNSKYVTVKLNE